MIPGKPKDPQSRTIAFFAWTLSNMPIILTVLAAIILTVLSTILDLDAIRLLQMTLGLLVGIALSLLADRYIDSRQAKLRQESIAESVGRIEKSIEGNGASLDSVVVMNRDLPSLEHRFEGAKRISISGGSLTRLATEYKHKFEELVAKGCEIRLLMVDPQSIGAQQLHEAALYGTQTLEDYRNQIERAIANLQTIEPEPPGRLDVRVASFAPPFSLVVMEHFDGRSNLQLQVYPFQVPARDRPTWIVDSITDPKLFGFFSSQFDRMWDSCSELRI